MSCFSHLHRVPICRLLSKPPATAKPRFFRTSRAHGMPPKNKYTDPKLRDEVKKDIQEGDKGGAPGQWSARKAQFMASEYKKRGGEYNTDKKDQDESQKNLSKWGEEEWQTKEGSGNAKQEDGTQKRYLPKKAWEQMDEQEKNETDEKKQAESKEGNQFVANTSKARGARKKANKDEAESYEAQEEEEKAQADGAKDDEDGSDPGEPDADYEEKAAQEEEEAESSGQEKPKRGRKRKSTQAEDSKKKQKTDNSKSSQKSGKTVGSKHDPADPPAKQASNDRLPKKGQSVTWKSMPGWVEGTVLEVAREDGITEGKSYKASKGNPTVVLRAKSGKVCAHKAKSIYFD